MAEKKQKPPLSELKKNKDWVRLQTIKSETTRFLTRLDSYIEEVENDEGWLWHSEKNATAKRASLDLGKMLAKWRQGKELI